MKIIQRIGSDPALLELLLEMQEKHPGCFTDVWLNTAYGYPKNEDHAKVADELAEAAQRLREKGIRVSMQLSNTLGHGQYMMLRDCSGLVFEGSPVRKMVGHDGVQAEYAFCWNDPYFRNYLTEHVRDYMKKVRPAELWIDDDLRANNHNPVRFGCFCDDCVTRFNRENGTAFDREELVEEYLHGDTKVRQRYIQFVCDGLAGLTAEICRAVHEESPETVVALQNGNNVGSTGCDHKYLLDAMYRVTGHPPMYRAGAGSYDDFDPNAILFKAYHDVAWQHAKLPDYVTCRCPEIENLPNNAFGKTMYGTALEATLNFACGSTGISFAMLEPLPEDAPFYEKGFARFAALRPYWERLAEISEKSVNGGITYARSKQPHLRQLAPEEGMESLSDDKSICANCLVRTGIPLGFDERENAVYFLHPEAARQMTRQELEQLLAKNVVTDGETVEYLKTQGIDLGVEMLACDEAQKLTALERYSNHPVNAVGRDHFPASFFAGGRTNYRMLTRLPEGSEVLGWYQFGDQVQKDKYSAAVIQTTDGGTWAVMGYALWVGKVPSAQRNRLQNIIDYISGKAPAVRLLSPEQTAMIPRTCKTTGKTLAVSVCNCTIEPQRDLKIAIRRPASEHFHYICQYGTEMTLTAQEQEGEYILTIPEVAPWGVATVFCD